MHVVRIANVGVSKRNERGERYFQGEDQAPDEEDLCLSVLGE
jgi:hypothetical protein